VRRIPDKSGVAPTLIEAVGAITVTAQATLPALTGQAGTEGFYLAISGALHVASGA
jgi:hypothetical protein